MSGTQVGFAIESLVREVLEEETGRAVFRVASESMRPRLIVGDRIVVRKTPSRTLTPGDVIVFRSQAAGLVVHRLIWRNRPLGEPTRIFTRGDALGALDRSVPVENVLGRVESIIRGGNTVRPTTIADRARCFFLAAGYGLRRLLRFGSRSLPNA